MASSARHLSLLALMAVLLAVVAPRASAWGLGGDRFFSSKTTRPQQASAVVVEPEKPAAADAVNPNSATEFSRPSTGGGGRAYGLYGRPEENYPPGYFRRGVHRNAEKLTTTTTSTSAAAEEAAVPVGVGGGQGERPEASTEDNGSGRGRPPWTSSNVNVPTTTSTEQFVEDNGSGRGRPPWTSANVNVPTTTSTEPFVEDNGSGRGRPPWTSTTEETVPEERAEPFAEEDNGSGMGRWPWRYAAADGNNRRPEEEQQRRNYYGMSDTRLYQNGRYYYDVDTGRYGYGRESDPVRTRPEEFAAGDRRGRYYYNGNAAQGYNRYGNGNGFGNQDEGFQVEGRNGRYVRFP